MLNYSIARTTFLMLALTGSVATAAWSQSAPTLTYKGDVVSHGLRVVNGTVYVPLSDVAHILGGTAAKTSGGYQINPPASPASAGGADQVNGLSGKIGVMLFTGRWRFEVTGVTHVPTFQTQYEPTTETLTPSGTNDELVIVSCIAKNGTALSDQLGLRTGNMYHTALADDQGQSYQPNHFDFPGGSGYGPTLLPGATVKFNVAFDVPKGTNIKDLVFSVWSFGYNFPKDLRISLTP